MTPRQIASAVYTGKAKTAWEHESLETARRHKFEAAQSRRRDQETARYAEAVAFARAIHRA